MTPPHSDRASTVSQRTWRHQTRLRLLRSVGHMRCAFEDETCGGRLEFAHRFPLLRDPETIRRRRSLDDTLREVRDHPFLFVVACVDHHRRLDAPLSGGAP